MSFRIKVWGSRGSLPSPYSPENLHQRFGTLLHKFFDTGFQSKADIPTFLAQNPVPMLGGYGGNTPCIEIKTRESHFIIDGGSGLRLLGYELMAGPCGKGQGVVHLFFTHFHWDHLIGLPFFVPIFIPGNQIHVYSVQPELEDVFKTLFKKPYFPVPLGGLGAKVHYHQIEPRVPFVLGDAKIIPYELDHPDPCWGYRVECEGKSYAHCVDTEAKRVSREELGPDLALYQNTDLMIFDAQYTLLETLEKIDWGHAAASLGLDIAMREGIKKVFFMHHDPASSDDKIGRAETEARRYYESQLKSARRANSKVHEVDWSFAYDGLVIHL